jgi:hypothetical protein
MSYVLKTIFFTFYLFLLYLFVFSCIFYNSAINTVKFKSFVEVYPIEGNPIEVYPIEAYLIGKGVVEISGCSQTDDSLLRRGGSLELDLRAATLSWESCVRNSAKQNRNVRRFSCHVLYIL